MHTTSRRRVVHSRTMRAFGIAAVIAVATLTLTLLTLAAAQGPPSDLTAFQIIVASSADEDEQVRVQLAGGADFTAVAREKSIDPTARDGGHIGKLSVAALRPELRDAVQGLKSG